MFKYILLITLFCYQSWALRTATMPMFTAQTIGAVTINSGPVDIGQILDLSLIAIYTGTPVGVLQIQVSNAIVNASQAQITATPSLIPATSWITYGGTSQSISAAGSSAWNLPDVAYRYLRVQYAGTSSSGVLNANMTIKGQ